MRGVFHPAGEGTPSYGTTKMVDATFSCHLPLEPRGLPQSTVQAVDQRIDLAAVTLEKVMELLFAIEPSAESTIHGGGALSNVRRCLWRLRNLSENRAGFHERSRIFGRPLTGQLRKGITQLLGFLSIHLYTADAGRSRFLP